MHSAVFLLVAETDVPTVLGASVLATVLGGAAALLTRWLTFRKESQQQQADNDAAAEQRDRTTRKDAYREARDAYREVIQRLQEQSDRREVVIREHELASEAWRRAAAECQEYSAEQRTVNHFLVEALRRAFTELRALGRDPGPLPDLPACRSQRTATEAEFLSRQAAQSAQVVRELDSHIGEPAPPTPGGSAPPKGGG